MGTTVDDALANAEDALADFVDRLKEQGEAIPPPSPSDSVELQPGEMVALVTLRTVVRQNQAET